MVGRDWSLVPTPPSASGTKEGFTVDERRFDAITKAWATGASRRRVLKAVAGAGLLALGGRRAAAHEDPLAVPPVDAEELAALVPDCGYPGFPCCPTVGGGRACQFGFACIDGVCQFDLEIDFTGEPCGPVTCPVGQVCCNASCGICTEPGGACIQVVCE